MSIKAERGGACEKSGWKGRTERRERREADIAGRGIGFSAARGLNQRDLGSSRNGITDLIEYLSPVSSPNFLSRNMIICVMKWDKIGFKSYFP